MILSNVLGLFIDICYKKCVVRCAEKNGGINTYEVLHVFLEDVR